MLIDEVRHSRREYPRMALCIGDEGLDYSGHNGIWGGMGYQLRRRRLSELVEDPENTRVHDERNRAAIRASLKEFGQVEPLVVRRANNVVIGGNGRLTVMRELGWTEADVIEMDIDEERARALSMALNRTAELATWDYRKLSALLKRFEATGRLDELAIGWKDYELSPLLQAKWEPVRIEGDMSEYHPKEDDKDKPKTIKVSPVQWQMFVVAANRVRDEVRDMEDGECLRVICDAFMEHYGSARLR